MDPNLLEVGSCTCGHVFTVADLIKEESIALNCPVCKRDNILNVVTQPTEEEYYANIAENIKDSFILPQDEYSSPLGWD